MSEQKSPYPNHTLKQIAYAEFRYFMIQVGKDFIDHNGAMTFTKKTAITLYNKILDSLMQTIYNGSEEDKATALRCLGTVRIIPLRLH